MKKVLLGAMTLGMVAMLTGCVGFYREGRCDHLFVLHPQISITRIVGC